MGPLKYGRRGPFARPTNATTPNDNVVATRDVCPPTFKLKIMERAEFHIPRRQLAEDAVLEAEN